jgi:hypothetical protein
LTDLDTAFAGLTEPQDLSEPFNKLLGELESKVTETVIMKYAIALLEGDDPSRYPTALRHLGGGHADVLLRTGDFTFWPEVWGARTLQYVWAADQSAEAARLIVGGLADQRWRLAEMCSKVVRKRELAQGADALVPLTNHELPRVRMQAVRALGAVGETEHLPVLHAALTDRDKDVRLAAAKAMELRAGQLDLDLVDLMEGRFR